MSIFDLYHGILLWKSQIVFGLGRKKKANVLEIIMADFKFEITEEIGVLSTSKSGWTRELNMVSWNGGEPKYDLRDWSPDHEKMGKGISLNLAEVKALKELLEEVD